MKRIGFYMVFVLVSASGMLISCGKHETTNLGPVEAVLQNGSWSISYYYEGYTDRTNQLSDFTFIFGSNGVLTATKPGYTSTGSWEYESDNQELRLSIGAQLPLSDLTDSYYVVSYNDKEVKLREIITAKDCYLTFTRK